MSKNQITHAEMILRAISEFRKQGIITFSRDEIRTSLGINSEDWSASFNPIIQGMRVDQPGGAPPVKERYQNVFSRIRRGVYKLTDYGVTLVDELNSQSVPLAPSILSVISTAEITNKQNLNQSHKTYMSRSDQAGIYAGKVELILCNAESFHTAYYRSEVFGKPCLYFHLQALKTRHDPTSVKHLEYVYATLIAWGMNRLGKGGSKMKDFDTFSTSIQRLRNYILKAQTFNISNLDEERWSILEIIFRGIQVMDSNASLVGNSKVMHHLLPDVIPPIDRTYTLSYLFGNKTIQNDLDSEWQIMKEVTERFFLPIASDNKFRRLADSWMCRADEYTWDTSLLKVIDNLVVGSKK